jgi:hypothetical protein
MTKQDWSAKYSAALSETNRNLLAIRIDEAQKAMLERSREIPETSHERQRLIMRSISCPYCVILKRRTTQFGGEEAEEGVTVLRGLHAPEPT